MTGDLQWSRFINSRDLSTSMTQMFHVVIEQDEDGVYIGRVIDLPGCITQGDALDELMKNVREAIELYLEVQSDKKIKVNEEQVKFIGVQAVDV
ncbi:MAG: hypothetical protein QS99_C0014G0024 [archaeon GW2011_AR4]|nr:MAG: hypothetical protein QS99_C0014G0024 [archaeon GW2011_AR4]